MIKTFFILLSVFQINSAIWDKEAFPKEHEALATAKSWWEEMPNWEGKFLLADQSATIHHEKGGIWIEYNSDLVTPFNAEKNIQNLPYQEKCDEIYLMNWQNKELNCPLRLKAHSSRNDFVTELIRSGLYKGTFEEGEIFFRSYRWEGDFTVVNLFFTCTGSNGKKIKRECRTIRHDLRGIWLYDERSDRIEPIIFTFLRLYCRDGKVLILHQNQSYYEFMMRLIEANHVSFMRYPPYTIQGKTKFDKKGKSIHYLECYYYGPLKESSNPLYPEILKERKRREQEKLRMKAEEEKRIRIRAKGLKVSFAAATEIMNHNSADDEGIINSELTVAPLAASTGEKGKTRWWNFSLPTFFFTKKIHTL